MSTPRSLPIPARLLVLDAIGTLLLALGYAEQFTSLSVLPAELQFPGDGIAIMAAGAMMIAPLVTHFISRVTQMGEARRRENADRR